MRGDGGGALDGSEYPRTKPGRSTVQAAAEPSRPEAMLPTDEAHFLVKAETYRSHSTNTAKPVPTLDGICHPTPCPVPQSRCEPQCVSLFDRDGRGDLGPEPCKLHGHHQLLGVPVHMHVQHEVAEGCPEIEGQHLICHAEEDQVHTQLLGDLLDGQVLAIQAHAGKELQLVPAQG